MMASGGTELERPDFTPQPPKEPDEGELLIVVQGVSVDVKPDEPNLQLDELILQGTSLVLKNCSEDSHQQASASNFSSSLISILTDSNLEIYEKITECNQVPTDSDESQVSDADRQQWVKTLMEQRNNVKSIENNDAIVHLKELKVTQKELLGDLIDNQLLLTSGKPPYCVLCGRKKVNKISSSCVRCQHKSTEAIKCCLKCKQLKEYTSDYTALCADSGHQCLHTESFKLCFKCKELKEYTTSNPSFGEDTKCVHCDSMDTELIKRCTKCKQLKEYKSMASASKSCVACGCKSTESFNRCTSCKLPKVTAVASHAIQKCTLKNMEKESGDGAVIYSHKHGVLKNADDVTWQILCSYCEHANDLNVAERIIEEIRQWLNCDVADYEYAKIEVHYVKSLLLAAAFDMYRGFMVNVDFLKELCSPDLVLPLLRAFYSLKRYCQNPTDHPPPDIYFFLLPSYNVFRDFGHQQIEQKHILHDPYMRMIKFTHVATTVPGSPEHSFLYTSFDRFHFVLLLSKELEPRMLSRYQTTDTMQPELYCPNLSRHQSSEAPLDLMLWTKESIFPKLLYDLGYEGAKKLEIGYLKDDLIWPYLTFGMQTVRGIINVCDERSPQEPIPPSRPIEEVDKGRDSTKSAPAYSNSQVKFKMPVQEVGGTVATFVDSSKRPSKYESNPPVSQQRKKGKHAQHPYLESKRNQAHTSPV